MMWPARSRLMRSMIDASVVDFPDPVGPVTSTKPLASRAKSATDAGTPRSSSGLISKGMARMTAPRESRWRKTLTRNRDRPGTVYDRSSSSSFSNVSRWRWVRIP